MGKTVYFKRLKKKIMLAMIIQSWRSVDLPAKQRQQLHLLYLGADVDVVEMQVLHGQSSSIQLSKRL